MFLGLTVVAHSHHWDTWFVIAIVCCTLWRSIGILFFSSVLNKLRKKNLSKVDQFMLSYGGLRGAIGYGLALSIPDSIVAKTMFVTATMAIIFFNVIVQGITIKPLVKYFKLESNTDGDKTDDSKVSRSEEDSRLYKFLTKVDAKLLCPILIRHHKAATDVELSDAVNPQNTNINRTWTVFGNILHQKFAEGLLDSSTYEMLAEALGTAEREDKIV